MIVIGTLVSAGATATLTYVWVFVGTAPCAMAVKFAKVSHSSQPGVTFRMTVCVYNTRIFPIRKAASSYYRDSPCVLQQH
jgi:hypothetical protein